MIQPFPSKAPPGQILVLRGDDGDWALDDKGHLCGPEGCDHASDCAVHNEPAYPNGQCDCGAA